MMIDDVMMILLMIIEERREMIDHDGEVLIDRYYDDDHHHIPNIICTYIPTIGSLDLVGRIPLQPSLELCFPTIHQSIINNMNE
jgi:hypothetical protein